MWLAKKREVKTRNNLKDLAQDAQGAQVSHSAQGAYFVRWVDWAKGEPRVISAWARAASLPTLCNAEERENWFMIPWYSELMFESVWHLQQNLDITISRGNNDLPSVPPIFCGIFNNIPIMTIIVRFCGPIVRIYDRYRYIYAYLYWFILFMHVTYLKS